MWRWLAALVLATAACTQSVAVQSGSHQAPSPRTDASSTFDAANGTIVLFGGADRSGVLGDTWTWDGSRWAIQHPAASPSAREFAFMGYDPATSRVVLFGGTTCAPPATADVTGCDYQKVQTNLDDTWTWDGATWSRVDTIHAPRTQVFRGDFGGLAADPGHRNLILVTWPTGSDRSTVETWTLQGGDWLQLHPAHAPASYEFSGPTYDQASGHVILQQVGERLGVTYWWDGSDWHFFDLSVRTPHSYGQLVSAGKHGLLLIWSGNVYAWDGRSWSGVRQLPASVSALKHPRNGWTASFHQPTGELVLFGGRAGSGGPELMGDTAGWDGSTWRTLVAGPTPPSGPFPTCSPEESESGLGNGPVHDPLGVVVEVDFSEPPSGACHLQVVVTMTLFEGNSVVQMVGNPATQKLDADLARGQGIAAVFDVHGGCSLPSATMTFQFGETQVADFALSIFSECGQQTSGSPSITTSTRPL